MNDWTLIEHCYVREPNNSTAIKEIVVRLQFRQAMVEPLLYQIFSTNETEMVEPETKEGGSSSSSSSMALAPTNNNVKFKGKKKNKKKKGGGKK